MEDLLSFKHSIWRNTSKFLVGSLALLAFLTVAILLLFFGVVRFGRVNAGRIEFSELIGSAGEPKNPSNAFWSDGKRIYACLKVKSFDDTSFEFNCEHNGKVIYQREGCLADLKKRSTGNFIAVTARVSFYLDRPNAGWNKGTYEVRITLGGKLRRSGSFLIRSRGTSGESELEMMEYEDNSTGIVFSCPRDWVRVKYKTDSLTGFGAVSRASSIYPPRVVIYATNLRSAEAQSLNEMLKNEGQTSKGMFTSYLVGEMEGAYRTFEWEISKSGQRLKLKSVQVLLKSPEAVLGINCHSLAEEFESNVKIFNRMINAVRYRD